MEDFIIVAVLVAIIGAAVFYIVKEKKRGVKCIGCPAAGACSRSKSSGCSGGCGSTAESNSENCSGCHTDTK